MNTQFQRQGGFAWMGQRRQIIEWQRAGWTVTRTNGGHLKLSHPQANTPIFTASTPSDWRARENIDAQMRRALAQGKGTDAPVSPAKPQAPAGVSPMPPGTARPPLPDLDPQADYLRAVWSDAMVTLKQMVARLNRIGPRRFNAEANIYTLAKQLGLPTPRREAFKGDPAALARIRRRGPYRKAGASMPRAKARTTPLIRPQQPVAQSQPAPVAPDVDRRLGRIEARLVEMAGQLDKLLRFAESQGR